MKHVHFGLAARTGVLALSWMVSLGRAFAQDAPSDAALSAADATAAVAPASPKGLEKKRGLQPQTLAEKRQGGYFTGFPIVNSDPDKGIGFGARVIYYRNGQRSNPFFRFSPYFHRVYFQYFRTTRGFQVHAIKSDSPYLGNTLFRLRTAFAYERDVASNYFGIGSESLEPLQRSDQQRSFAKIEDYDQENRRVIDGKTFARYNKFEIFRPRANFNLEREFWGGLVRPLIGFQVAKIFIDDSTGKQVTVDKDEAIGQPTLLFEDRPRIRGFDGGWNNTLRLGIAYDTRDFEPAPSRGSFHDFTYEASHHGMGSEFNYHRGSVALRYYYSPAPRLADLVLAGRAVYQVQGGQIPFYEMGTLVYTQGNDNGLGGLRSLRGYVDNRFIGPVVSLANLEARWTLFNHSWGSQRFAHSVAPFLDTGRVYDRVSQTTLRDWKFAGGAGYRIAWNQATIILIDYGVSDEGRGVYINFGHMY